jgi:hypothetical protein
VSRIIPIDEGEDPAGIDKEGHQRSPARMSS